MKYQFVHKAQQTLGGYGGSKGVSSLTQASMERIQRLRTCASSVEGHPVQQTEERYFFGQMNYNHSKKVTL
jgi:hypothetical protein